jgi:hypothetical protein
LPIEIQIRLGDARPVTFLHSQPTETTMNSTSTHLTSREIGGLFSTHARI